ncbi:MAG: hypothetical protein IJS99_07205 [Synergistaceae bacterium]|nr:hypothetical protein [Synergistaceae bacterium]
MKRFILAAFVIALSLSTAAFAQDLSGAAKEVVKEQVKKEIKNQATQQIQKNLPSADIKPQKPSLNDLTKQLKK